MSTVARKPIAFQAQVGEGGTVTVLGWPTGTPGLLVHQPDRRCPDHENEACWVVSHRRAGLKFPWCWESPEAALAFANDTARFGDWTITGVQLQRRMRLRYVRRALTDRALTLGGWPRFNGEGNHCAVDNGAAA